MWNEDEFWEIMYEKGGDRYSIRYYSLIGHALDIQRTPKRAYPGWYVESTSLKSIPVLPEFNFVVMQYGRSYPNGKFEHLFNTPTADQRIQDFRRRNFGKPESQPPAEK